MGRRKKTNKMTMATTSWSTIPKDLLEAVGRLLSLDELKVASLTCKSWAKALRQGVRTFSTEIPSSDLRGLQKIQSLSRVTPELRALELAVSRRVTTEVANNFFSELGHCPNLTELQLNFWGPVQPWRGSYLQDFQGLQLLTKLTSLRAFEVAQPQQGALAALSGLGTLVHLTELVLLAGEGVTQAYPCHGAPYMHPMLIQRAPSECSLAIDLPSHLSQLVNLRCLVVSAGDSQSAQILQCCYHLSSLTHLELPDARVSQGELAPLASLQQLRYLKVGVDPEEMDMPEDLIHLPPHTSVHLLLPEREDIKKDLSWFATHLRERVIGLDIEFAIWDDHVASLLSELTSLCHLTIQSPIVVNTEDDEEEYQIDLGVLTRIRGMKLFQYSGKEATPMVLTKTRIQDLVTGWPHLRALMLDDLTSTEVADDSLVPLTQLQHLSHLTLKGMASSPRFIRLAINSLPASLLTLSLAYVKLMGLPTSTDPHRTCHGCKEGVGSTWEPWKGLLHLELDHCKFESGAHLVQCLQGLKRLEALTMDEVMGLSDSHCTEVFPNLRHLTSLTVIAVGNTHVTHCGLHSLHHCTRLRHLRWNVGDMMDLIPDVVALLPLTQLLHLSIPAGLHHQMTRWSAWGFMDGPLSLCDVQIEGGEG